MHRQRYHQLTIIPYNASAATLAVILHLRADSIILSAALNFSVAQPQYLGLSTTRKISLSIASLFLVAL
jgi:hypothetical protein